MIQLIGLNKGALNQKRTTGSYISLINSHLWFTQNLLDFGMGYALEEVISRFPSFGPEELLMCLGVFFRGPFPRRQEAPKQWTSIQGLAWPINTIRTPNFKPNFSKRVIGPPAEPDAWLNEPLNAVRTALSGSESVSQSVSISPPIPIPIPNLHIF
jgi:hypothetical protein